MMDYSTARGICAVCGSPIQDRPKTCAVCNTQFCHKHEHLVTLVRSNGTDVFQACNECITKYGYHVIDPTHPLYLNNKEKQS